MHASLPQLGLVHSLPQARRPGPLSSRTSAAGSSTVSAASCDRVGQRDGRHGGLAALAGECGGVGLEHGTSREVRGKYGCSQAGLSEAAIMRPGPWPLDNQHNEVHSKCGSLSFRGSPRCTLLSETGSDVATSQKSWFEVSDARSAPSVAGVGPLSEGPAVARGRCKEGSVKAKDKWLRAMCEEICSKASQRHINVQKALCSLDADGDGLIDKSELQYFFRSYNFPVAAVDRFLEYFGANGCGCIDYQEFVGFMVPVLQGKAPVARSMCSSDVSTREPSPSTAQEVATKRRDFEENLSCNMNLICARIEQRFKHPRDAFRLLDTDKDGLISRSEMRTFFRALNLQEVTADQFLEHFDEDACGEADYNQFVDFLASHLKRPVGPAPAWQWGGTELEQPQSKTNVDIALAPTNTSFLPSLRHSAETRGVSAIVSPVSRPQSSQESEESSRQELRALMLEIGRIPKKHNRCNRCPVTPMGGTVTCSEARTFLVGFGWPPELAERFFRFANKDGRDEVQYVQFMKLFRDAEKLRGKRDNRGASVW